MGLGPAPSPLGSVLASSTRKIGTCTHQSNTAKGVFDKRVCFSKLAEEGGAGSSCQSEERYVQIRVETPPVGKKQNPHKYHRQSTSPDMQTPVDPCEQHYTKLKTNAKKKKKKKRVHLLERRKARNEGPVFESDCGGIMT